MTIAAEGNCSPLPPTDAALDADETVHAALEGMSGCCACAAQKLSAALPPPEIQYSAASQARGYGEQWDNEYLRIANVTLEEISDDLHIA